MGDVLGRATSLGDRRLRFVTNINRADRKCRQSNGRINLRSESNGMEMFSVGLRRSEIDGYILRPTLTYAGFFSYALGYQSYAG